MTAVRRADEDGEKVTAVSRVEFQRVEFFKEPPMPPSPPAEPHSPLPYPPPPVPVGDPKLNIQAFAIEALLSAVKLVTGYRVSLLLFSNAKWPFFRVDPNPHPPLLPHKHCAPPSYVSYGTMDITPNLPPPQHDPITESASLSQRYWT